MSINPSSLTLPEAGTREEELLGLQVCRIASAAQKIEQQTLDLVDRVDVLSFRLGRFENSQDSFFTLVKAEAFMDMVETHSDLLRTMDERMRDQLWKAFKIYAKATQGIDVSSMELRAAVKIMRPSAFL